MTIRTYVAASLRWKDAAAKWADSIRATGIEVCSGWHDDPTVVDDLALGVTERQRAIRSITAELSRASVVVVLAHLGEPRATFVEAGMAIAMGKPVVWVCSGNVGRLVFDAHPRSVRVDLASTSAFVTAVHRGIREAVLL